MSPTPTTPTLLFMLCLSTIPAASFAQHHRKELSNARVLTATTSGGSYPSGECLTGAHASCSGVKPSSSAPCAQKKWAGSMASTTGSYCIADFNNKCDNADNAKYVPCAVFATMQNCRDKGWGTDCTRGTSNVIVRTRTHDASDPSKMCLMTQHWLVLATTPCTGIEDSTCNGGVSTSYFAHGAEFAASKKLPAGNWAMQVNAPDRRDGHQLHVHLAPISDDGKRNTPVGAILADKALSTNPNSPSGPYKVGGKTSYAVLLKKPISQVEPFAIGAELHKKAGLGSETASTPYGVGVIPDYSGPAGKGVVVFTTYRFSQYDYLSQKYDSSNCEKKGL